ncbi:hypothetical protein R1sor_015684 [Riccia sorocarpa]|uniref:Uncharacterized protein n=1 Tax=Riccia sorocarpa TaxID=122646 RepID=A0ABD3HGW4_9MARC
MMEELEKNRRKMKGNWFKPFQGMELQCVNSILGKLLGGELLLRKSNKFVDDREDLQSFCTWMKIEDRLFDEMIRFFGIKFDKGVTRKELSKKYNVTSKFLKEVQSLLFEEDMAALKRNVKWKGVPAVLENKLVALYREATAEKVDQSKVTFEGMFNVLISLFSKCEDMKFVLVVYLLPTAISDIIASFKKFDSLVPRIVFDYYIGFYEPERAIEDSKRPVKGQAFLKMVVFVTAEGKEFQNCSIEKKIDLSCRKVGSDGDYYMRHPKGSFEWQKKEWILNHAPTWSMVEGYELPAGGRVQPYCKRPDDVEQMVSNWSSEGGVDMDEEDGMAISEMEQEDPIEEQNVGDRHHFSDEEPESETEDGHEGKNNEDAQIGLGNPGNGSEYGRDDIDKEEDKQHNIDTDIGHSQVEVNIM